VADGQQESLKINKLFGIIFWLQAAVFYGIVPCVATLVRYIFHGILASGSGRLIENLMSLQRLLKINV
jgi:hypothetical protein